MSSSLNKDIIIIILLLLLLLLLLLCKNQEDLNVSIWLVPFERNVGVGQHACRFYFNKLLQMPELVISEPFRSFKHTFTLSIYVNLQHIRYNEESFFRYQTK